MTSSQAKKLRYQAVLRREAADWMETVRFALKDFKGVTIPDSYEEVSRYLEIDVHGDTTCISVDTSTANPPAWVKDVLDCFGYTSLRSTTTRARNR